MALVAAAGAATAQGATVEFRIVERQGQTQIVVPIGATPTTDAVLNFAVQARVVGGAAGDSLGNFNFDILGTSNNGGEPESRGTLAKLLTSNADGTLSANSTQSSGNAVGRHGLSAPYTYLAGINAAFNGSINASSGTFSNTPNQDIGLITGSPTGSAMLLVTDVVDFDGNPDTYPGTGTSADIDPAIASVYFGAGGNFCDIYRFKYTVTDLTTNRVLNFSLANVGAQIMTSFVLSNGVWGPSQTNAQFSTADVSIAVITPAPASAALLGLGGLVAARRRRTASVA
jgi:hypothetical protein